MSILIASGSVKMIIEDNAKKVYDAVVVGLTRLGGLYDDLHIYVNGHEGFSEAVAKAAHRLHIPYSVVLSNPNFIRHHWVNNPILKTTSRKQTIDDILARATEIITVCDFVYVDGIHSNYIRNQWMIDKALEDERRVAMVYEPMTNLDGRNFMTRVNKAMIPYYELTRSTMEWGSLRNG